MWKDLAGIVYFSILFGYNLGLHFVPWLVCSDFLECCSYGVVWGPILFVSRKNTVHNLCVNHDYPACYFGLVNQSSNLGTLSII